jgi:nitronate monooxygenase
MISAATKRLLKDTGARVPVVCGPMYPGSNPELVAAVSDAGGFGVVQPIALTRLYGHDYREGLRLIKSLTDKPFGVNITILPKTAASAKYAKMNEMFADIAIEEGVEFLLTSLGKPNDIVEKAHANGVKVYHDVHNAKLAKLAYEAGVDGLNLLNSSMGGQTGAHTAEEIIAAVKPLVPDDFPLMCAGGVATKKQLNHLQDLGYAGAQLGTRFLATHEANVTDAYKQAIVKASSSDIVWTNKLAGTNSSVINTPMVSEGGLRTNALVSFLLRTPATKALTRLYLLQGALEKYDQAAFDPEVSARRLQGAHNLGNF